MGAEMKSLAVLMVAVLCGCAGTSEHRAAIDGAWAEISAAHEATAANQPARAEAHFRQARQVLSDGYPRAYYTHEDGQPYRLMAFVDAQLSWALLEQGRVQDAAGVSRQSFLDLKAAMERHQRIRQSGGLMKQFGAVGLVLFGAYADARSAQVGSAGYGGGSFTEGMLEFVDSVGWLNPDVEIPPVGLDTRDPDSHVIRFPVMPLAGYLKYVGRVVTNESQCTGTAVFARIVLTNAHCIFTDGGGRRFAFPWQFRREVLIQDVGDSVGVMGYYTHQGWNAGWDGDRMNDWAILVLAQDYSVHQQDQERGEAFYFSTPESPTTLLTGFAGEGFDEAGFRQDYIDPERTWLAGYSNDLNRGHYLTMHVGCHIRDDAASGGFIHNCDSERGSSGGGIFAWNREWQKFMLIGLNAAQYTAGPHAGWGIALPPSRYVPGLREVFRSLYPQAAAERGW